ncbi:MAG: metallophosphoesterase [Treponema sp.]|nr:metallophosphoesterase [Treponema sp.]
MVTKAHSGKTAILKAVSLFELLAALVLSAGCNVDLFGFFVSSELDDRLESRDDFHFLSDADRNLSLGETYSFLALTDTHIEGGDAHELEKLMGHIAPSDKFVVVTGDITQNGRREDVEKFIEIAKILGIPCYPVIGNHDIYLGNFSNWRDLIGSTSYRIDHSNTTLFFLDSANASFGASQIDWLLDALETAQGHVFVFSHVNLFVGDIRDLVHAGQITETRERAKILSFLKGRVDAVFAGHLHKRIIREAGGVAYIVTEDFKDNKTYCRVHVSDEGIRLEFLEL